MKENSNTEWVKSNSVVVTKAIASFHYPQTIALVDNYS